MNLLIHGAGAIGCYLGAHLSRVGHDVTLVTRPRYVDHILRQGIILTEAQPIDDTPSTRNITVQPDAVGSFSDAIHHRSKSYHAVILSMKSYDVGAAVDEIAAHFPNVPAIITTQNGIGIEEKVIEQFGPDTVVAGSVSTPVSRDQYGGVLVEKSGRGFVLARTERGQEIQQWVNLFQNTLITTSTAPNHHTLKWSKALLNIIGNATSAILGWHPADIYRHEQLFDLEIAMLREALAIMDKRNIKVIDFPGAPAKKLAIAVRRLPRMVLRRTLVNMVAKGRGNKMPSFHIDLMAGKTQSEVLYHNAAIAKAGRELGIPTPVNTTLAETLLRIAGKQWRHDAFSNNPRALLEAVERRRKARELGF